MKNLSVIKSILLLILTAYFATATLAQVQYLVRGSLVAENGETVPFAHVQLLEASDSSFVAGVISDEEGQFSITHTKPGHFLISASYIGLAPAYRELFLDDHFFIELDKIILNTTAKELSTITVSTSRLKAIRSADKTSYFIGEDLRVASRNGVDLLKAVPGVQIDLNQKMTIAGADNILVLVNGKERELAFLSQIDPNRIAYVEISKSPGAKYGSQIDAVVNVVLTEEKQPGLSGYVNLTVPTNTSEIYSFPSVKLAYSRGKNTFFTSYEGGFSFFDIQTTDHRIIDSRENKRKDFLRQENASHRLHFGAERSIDSSSQLSLYGFIGQFSNEQSGHSNLFRKSDGQWDNSGIYYRDEQDDNKSYFISMFYNRQTGKNSYLDLESSYYQRRSDNLLAYDSGGTALFSSHSRPVARIWRSQANLRRVINGKISLETGFATRVHQYMDHNLDGFQYVEKAIGSYVSSSYIGSKLNVIGGVRTELLAYGSANSTNQWILLPSMKMSYQLSEIESVHLSYNKLVQTPALNEVNPMALLSDRNSITRGNAKLMPSITHNITASYSLTAGSSFLQGSLFYINRAAVIDRLIAPDENGNLYEQYFNLGHLKELGTGLTGSIRAGDLFSISPQVRFSKAESLPPMNGQSLYTGKRDSWNIASSISSVFHLPHETNLWASIQYNARNVHPQYDTFEDPLYFLSVNKEFYQRFKVGVTTAVPFSEAFTYNGTTIGTQDVYQRVNREVVVSAFPVWINLSYSFHRGDRQKPQMKKHSFRETEKSRGF